ncbi:MAG TPA: hypothetical protein PLX56_03850, partial [bacterium]|nr:hypothetical protein [bacterium]
MTERFSMHLFKEIVIEKLTSSEIDKIKEELFAFVENNDDFLEQIKVFIKKEKVKCAFFVFLGAVVKAKMAAGPKKPVNPPVPNMLQVKDGWEVFGTGSVFLNKNRDRWQCC